MTMDHGTNGLLEKIYILQISHGDRLGKIEGSLDGIENRLDHIESNFKLMSIHSQEVSQKIVIHEDQLARHEKRLSNAFHKLETAENTGIHHLVEERARWRTMKTIAAVILGLLTAFGILAGVYSALDVGNHKIQQPNR